jgi:integrase
MALCEISAADVQRYLAGLVARPLAPSSVRRIFTILDQLLDAARDCELIAANPAERARLPRLVRSETRFLTPPELERLAVAITEPYRVMVLVMAYATLRIGEGRSTARRRRPSRRDAARGEQPRRLRGQLYEGPPKTEAERRSVSLPASILAELAIHLDRFAGEVCVFAAPDGGPLHPSRWRTSCWYPAVRAAGLRPLRVHDLEHSGVAFLISAGSIPKRSHAERVIPLWPSRWTVMATCSQRSTSRRGRSSSCCARRRRRAEGRSERGEERADRRAMRASGPCRRARVAEAHP